MNNIIVIIIVILLFVLAFILARRKKCKREKMAQIEKSRLPSYANMNDPYINPQILKNLISVDHCNQIIAYAKGKLIDSEVVSGKDENVRNSKQCWIPKNSPLVKGIFEKASQMFNIPLENAEDLQVVRYLPNQYFKEHHDGCCDDNDKCKEFIDKTGQRILTILIYLNNDFQDGHTYFPKLNLKIKTDPGNAIVFYPTATGTDKCHPLALHSGTPVTSGEKWVANLWFHDKKFN